jgi:hypothetical protein
MTFMLNGKQYIVVAAGPKILCFCLSATSTVQSIGCETIALLLLTATAGSVLGMNLWKLHLLIRLLRRLQAL